MDVWHYFFRTVFKNKIKEKNNKILFLVFSKFLFKKKKKL